MPNIKKIQDAILRVPSGLIGNPISWHVLKKWSVWILTLLTVVSIGGIIIPVLRRYPSYVHDYFGSQPVWKKTVVILSGSAIAGSLFGNLFSPRLGHIMTRSFALKHPPTWLAWLVGILLLGLWDGHYGLGPDGFGAALWQWLLHAGAFLTSAGFSSGSLSFSSLSNEFDDFGDEIERRIDAWQQLERWLETEKPADEDLLGNRRVARRLANLLQDKGGTVGLVGPFGSGKSSVIGWMKGAIASKNKKSKTILPHIWISEQTCWGFDDSDTAVEHILQGAIGEVGKHVDCFSLRFLPAAYRRTFSGGEDWIRTLSELILGSIDPLDQFQELSKVLESVDARLVLVIEDLDRTTSSRFDRQEVLALLQRLRASSDRFSFVLAAAPTNSSDIDFAKLCDHIELLPKLAPGDVARIINILRNACLDGFGDIVYPSYDNPWLRPDYMIPMGFGIQRMTDVAVSLLRTPRLLKHALRRTYQAWKTVHGEVDFDHLLLVNAIRSSAPGAFDFLLRNWESLHYFREPTLGMVEDRTLQEALQKDWAHVAKQTEWDPEAAMEVLMFLLPPVARYFANSKLNEPKRIQGIGENLYWRRVVNEEGPDAIESSDQAVLRDISDWKLSRSPSSPLIDNLVAYGEYVSSFERMSGFLSNEIAWFHLLFDQLLLRFKSPLGIRLTTSERQASIACPHSPHPAFIALCRALSKYTVNNEANDVWLVQCVGTSIHISIPLANDLYALLAHPEFGIATLKARAAIRNSVHTAAREMIKTGADYLRITDERLPYHLRLLVVPKNSDGTPHEYSGVEYWKWLGPILLGLLRENPTRVALDIAYVISDSTRTELDWTEQYFVLDGVLRGFFGSAAPEVIDLLELASHSFVGRDQEILREIVSSGKKKFETTTES